MSAGSHSLQAIAAHRNGGLVIVQVERVVEQGTIPARLVHIPGALVTKVDGTIIQSLEDLCVHS